MTKRQDRITELSAIPALVFLTFSALTRTGKRQLRDELIARARERGQEVIEVPLDSQVRDEFGAHYAFRRPDEVGGDSPEREPRS